MFMNQGELEVVKQETEEGNGTPLQCSCLENPRDGGALWAAIYGVAQSRTRLKRRSSSSKQEMARVNNDILEISELKWTRMGKFNSYDHCIYYWWQESLRRNGIALIVNKSPNSITWVQSQKRQNDHSLFPRKTIQYCSNSVHFQGQ